MKRYIDMETYPRRSHFDYFRSLAYPYVGFTANVDVTNLIRYAKEKGGSSFLAILWVASQAANTVPQLRQRIEGDRIVEYDHCDVGHTVALPDKTFCNCHTDCRMSIDEFLVYGKRQQEEAKKNFLVTITYIFINNINLLPLLHIRLLFNFHKFKLRSHYNSIIILYFHNNNFIRIHA